MKLFLLFILLINIRNIKGNVTEIMLLWQQEKLFQDNIISRNNFNRVSLCSQNLSNTVYQSHPSNDSKTNILTETDIFCSQKGKQISKLKEKEFSISENGFLYVNSTGEIFKHSEYCLRFIKKQNENYWTADLCLDTIKIPRCCFLDSSLESKCNQFNSTFDPPVRLDNITSLFALKEQPIYGLKCSLTKRVALDAFIYFTNQQQRLVFDYNGSTVGNFCIDKDKENNFFEINFCENNFTEASNCPEDKNCLRKCCPSEQMYDYETKSCALVQKEYWWNPQVYDSSDFKVLVPSGNYSFLYGFPTCKLFPLKDEDVYFALTDGQLHVAKYQATYPNNRYCIDHFKSGKSVAESVLLCFEEGGSKSRWGDCKSLRLKLFPAFMIVSCVFLSLTLLVYSILPDLYTKINGKCVIASTATLLGAYICLICMEWSSAKISMKSCQTLGLFSQFFSLSSFFWLNIMCFDVWRALRSQRSLAGRSAYSVNRRFIKYSSYAWGCPLIIGLVTALMQFLVQARNPGKKPITPGFGNTGCFSPKNDPKPYWTYFYGFIFILMVVNTFFFVHLMVLLHKERLHNDSVLRRRTTTTRNVMWMKLYFKLFGVMGITFIFEILSWVEGSCNLWIWTDSINALRGVLIFGIFVCKRNIFEKLKTRSNFSTGTFKMSLTSSSSGPSRVSSEKRSRFYVDIELNKNLSTEVAGQISQ